jgi:hypothetical protein
VEVIVVNIQCLHSSDLISSLQEIEILIFYNKKITITGYYYKVYVIYFLNNAVNTFLAASSLLCIFSDNFSQFIQALSISSFSILFTIESNDHSYSSSQLRDRFSSNSHLIFTQSCVRITLYSLIVGADPPPLLNSILNGTISSLSS